MHMLRPKALCRLEMLVRALKVLDFVSLRKRSARIIDTAALNQPGDEDRAYGRRAANWQRQTR
jgi:hypothetical protein